MMKIFLSKNKKIKAFTLLETLVSVAIVSVVIAGPLTVAVNSSSYARQSKDVMVATYLAEESLELLHNQYDSLYLACLNRVSPCGAGVGREPPAYTYTEEIGETAWRLFKDRLTSGQDCQLSAGCAYDFIDMTYSSTTAPVKYATDSSSPCHSLIMRSDTMTVLDEFGNNPQILKPRRYYVCSGASANHLTDNTPIISQTYRRKIIVTSLQTFVENTSPDLYHDDLRILARISFNRPNGISRNIDVVDFFHAR